jgi:hypothetical protein
MLLKAIQCHVLPEHKELFSRGQEHWATISSLPGFVAQQGGWQSSTAWVFGWWQNWDDYSAFMAKSHDPIFHGNSQEGTFRSSEISFWQSMPSAKIDRRRNLKHTPTAPASSISLDPDAADVEPVHDLILLELLQLAPGAWADFDDFLTWRWRPSLAGAGGLASARICQHRKLPGRYLSWSRWQAGADPIGMARLLQPGFRLPHRRTQLFRSLSQLQIRCVPTWEVNSESIETDSAEQPRRSDLD